MPIVRTYGCADCGHVMDVTLTMAQVDDPPPSCPRCAASTQQEFKPPAIVGSPRAKAVKLAEDIMEKDFGVADAKVEGKEGGTPKVRYKDHGGPNASTWGIAQEALHAAVQSGRQTRLEHGSGLDVLQTNIKNGVEPDLIELSKKRAIRVF